MAEQTQNGQDNHSYRQQDEKSLQYIYKQFEGKPKKAAKRIFKLEKINKVLSYVVKKEGLSTKEKEAIIDEINAEGREIDLHSACEALELDRGTYYNHKFRSKGKEAWFIQRHEQLCAEIRDIFYQSNEVYGAAKIQAKLKERGYKKVYLGYVKKLMREMGLRSTVSFSKKNFYRQGWQTRDIKNFKEAYHVSRPNQVWVSDTSEFIYSPHSKRMVICAYIDAYTHQVLACNVGYGKTTQLTKRTFIEAYKSAEPKGELILHTDNGSEYISKFYEQTLKEYNCNHCYNRPHHKKDNPIMESFFGVLKKESLYRCNFRSERDFCNEVRRFMNYYNSERPHGSLYNKTPNKYNEEYYKRHAEKTPNTTTLKQEYQ